MTYLKTQIEANFTYILNLGEVYKPVFAPYLNLAELQLNDEGGKFRSITMIFRNEGYSIFCEWNRLLLTCDGKTELVNTHGALFVFCNIMEKLKEQGLFGRVLNIAYAQCGLLVYNEDPAVIIERFRAKYIGGSYPLLQGATTESMTATSEQTGLAYSVRTLIGVYRKEQDITTFSLLPIFSKEVQDALAKNGVLSQVIQISNITSTETDVLAKLKEMDIYNSVIFNSINI